MATQWPQLTKLKTFDTIPPPRPRRIFRGISPSLSREHASVESIISALDPKGKGFESNFHP